MARRCSSLCHFRMSFQMISCPRILSAAITASALLASSAQACTDRQAAVDAVQAGDFPTAETLQNTISVDPACPDDFRLWLDEALARSYFARALDTLDPAQKRDLTQTSISFFPHWRSYSLLGDLAGQDGNQEDAARWYQQAINQMNDGPERHAASVEEAKALLTAASSAMLLAEGTIEIPATRSGSPGGIFIENLRGYQVEEVVLAIEYDFDSVDFTRKGNDVADQLLSYLLDRNPPRIVLEGHTDPVGAATYNDQLSLRRAESLRDYLASNGYKGVIGVVGRGETMVPPAPSGIAEDSPEHHQIARRVVLIR